MSNVANSAANDTQKRPLTAIPRGAVPPELTARHAAASELASHAAMVAGIYELNNTIQPLDHIAELAIEYRFWESCFRDSLSDAQSEIDELLAAATEEIAA